ncbi:MAG: lytic murein transglycosylase B [Nitrospirota bacterium]|nr:lytic murein transglycosylase B [Nitrospirota bacterium]
MLVLISALITLVVSVPAWAGKDEKIVNPDIGEYLQHPEYTELIDELATKHGFDRSQLWKWFRHVTLHGKIPVYFDRPAEAKPYHVYRGLFISDRVQKLGRRYLHEHAEMLAEVERRTGVEATAVAAIMGIETKFGSVKGGYHAFDALNSAFALYPSRRAFFRKELIEFLLLCREEGADPFDFDGSYAGALGMPQFMPSSFRAYAVDFDADGRRDIWKNHADVAGSIGNYLKRHGWKNGEPLAVEVNLTPEQAARFDGGHKEKLKLRELQQAGINASEFAPVDPSDKVAVVSYDEADGSTRYFVIFTNFFAIMRYNTSVNYAMVAKELDDYFGSRT